ncbi:MAG: RNA polymerase sigma-70 factor [Lewinellaceae bacterium]|nr:RNA polymerase sigma-70 factor [Saprospiraceae bacterium]MCB9316143.1 RNA polymerase sigma-70 factor [Lewinellaceae bacterium]MCB9329565.1 RNA polymerase sigma-70 factor [Lewinellaceae bacterium]
MSTETGKTELQWLTDLRKGDESALRSIFDHHYPLIIGDIYRYIPDLDTCKDLAQEVFVELWRKRETLDVHTSLRAYLRRAGINRALNYIKANRHTLLEDTTELWADLEDSTEQDAIQKHKQDSLEAALQVAIQQLPEKCRLVFSLSRFEQLSHKEIAQKLGISVKTIENQITKAMKLLREALLKYPNLSPVVICVVYWLSLR